MVIGNGSIAKIFYEKYKDDKNYLIFASGVSNSNEKNLKEFEREKNLIMDTIKKFPNLKLIYFSSIFVNVINNDYYVHKLNIEEIIKKNHKNYIIVRLPQIISTGGNKKNLINLFVDYIKKNKEIEIIENTFRSIIDIDDVYKIVNDILDKCNNEILFFYGFEKIEVINLYNKISKILSIPPKIKLINSNFIFDFEMNNSQLVNESINNCDIEKTNYVDNFLKKYIKI